MKKYSVTLYYHTNIVTEVSANSEKEAIEQARQMAARDNQEIIDILLGGMYEDGQPDCEEVGDVVERMRTKHTEFVEQNKHNPKFAHVIAKYDDSEEKFNAYIKLHDFIPCHTDGDPDDEYVLFYSEGINGLCDINTDHNADFSIIDIIEFCDTCGNENEEQEETRHALSRLLMDTDEAHPMHCDITLQSGACGLSELEKPTVKKLFQDSEAIIWVCIEGHHEPIELDDIPMEWQQEIVNYFYV